MLAEFLADWPRFAVILILFAGNLAASVLLVRAAVRRPWIAALVERAEVAVLLLVAQLFGLVIYIDHRLVEFALGADAMQWLVTAIAVLISVPAVWWLVLYLRGGFDA